MKVAIAQIEAGYYAKDKNEGKILSLTDQALEQGVDLILFPEGANLGYFILDQTKEREEALSLALGKAPDFSSPWIELLRRKAQKGIYIACGCFLKNENSRLVNALLLLSPKGEIFSYNKTHLFHLKETKEADFVVGGYELTVVDTPLAKIGLCICYDLNFPEVIRTLALKGAQIVLLPAAWPKMAGRTWDLLLSARAIENELYVVACGQTGEAYYGHSKIIDYTGNILTEFAEEEGLRVAEVDLTKQEKWRKMVTYFEDRRPALYNV